MGEAWGRGAAAAAISPSSARPHIPSAPDHPSDIFFEPVSWARARPSRAVRVFDEKGELFRSPPLGDRREETRQRWGGRAVPIRQAGAGERFYHKYTSKSSDASVHVRGAGRRAADEVAPHRAARHRRAGSSSSLPPPSRPPIHNKRQLRAEQKSRSSTTPRKSVCEIRPCTSSTPSRTRSSGTAWRTPRRRGGAS